MAETTNDGSAAVTRTSRIGKRPVVVPKGVSAAVRDGRVEIAGPKGAVGRALPAEVTVTQEGDRLIVRSSAPGRSAARLQGLARALVASMVRGVTEGYQRKLELQGTGYRVEVKGNALHFALGYSHPIEFPLPPGVTADVPKESKGTQLTLWGCDNEVLGQAAATIRGFRTPSPYGGKGVRYAGERVREKAGKAGKAGAAGGKA
jgi:large subunit ribosomal protein L6